MDGKRTPELPDEALDLVAGGLSMGSSLPGTTYSTSGPSVTGPGAAPVTRGGDSLSKHTDMSCEGDMILMQLFNAGTLEQYQSDFQEYSLQHAEWRSTRERLDGSSLAGPEPVRPNPYDYL